MIPVLQRVFLSITEKEMGRERAALSVADSELDHDQRIDGRAPKSRIQGSDYRMIW